MMGFEKPSSGDEKLAKDCASALSDSTCPTESPDLDQVSVVEKEEHRSLSTFPKDFMAVQIMRQEEMTYRRKARSKKATNSKDIYTCANIKASLLKQNKRGSRELKKLHETLYEMLDVRRTLREFKAN